MAFNIDDILGELSAEYGEGTDIDQPEGDGIDELASAYGVKAPKPAAPPKPKRILAPKEDDASFRKFFTDKGFGVNRTFGRAINPGSLHPSGLAADIDFHGKSDDEIGDLVAEALKRGYRVFDERVPRKGVKQTGPHLHFERNNGNKRSSFLEGKYGKYSTKDLADLDAQRLGLIAGAAEQGEPQKPVTRDSIINPVSVSKQLADPYGAAGINETQERIDDWNRNFPNNPYKGRAPRLGELAQQEVKDNIADRAGAGDATPATTNPELASQYEGFLRTVGMQDSNEARKLFNEALSHVPAIPQEPHPGQRQQRRAQGPHGAPQQPMGQFGPTSVDRIAGQATDADTGILGTTRVNPKWTPEQKLQAAMEAQLREYDVTPQQISEFIADRKRRGVKLLGDDTSDSVSIPQYILNEIKGPEGVIDQRMRQSQARTTRQRGDMTVGKNWVTEDADWLNSNAGSALIAVNPLFAFLDKEQRDNIGSSLVGGVIGAGSRTIDTLAGTARVIDPAFLAGLTREGGEATLRNSPLHNKSGDEIYNYLREKAESGHQLNQKTGDGGFVSKLVKFGGGLAGDVPRLILLSKLPGGAIAGMSADMGLQSAGRGEDPSKIGVETAKGAAMGAVFALAPTMGKLVLDDAAALTGRQAAGKLAQEAVTTGIIGGGSYLVEMAAGSDEEQALHSGALNALLHLVTRGISLAGKTARVRDAEGNEVTVGVDPQGNVKLLKGQDPQLGGKVDVEVVLPPKQLKGSPEGNKLQNPGPGEKAVEAPESLTEIQKIEQPDPVASELIKKDKKVPRIENIISTRGTVTLDELAKATKYDKVALETTLMNMYGAGLVQFLPGNRVQLTGKPQEAVSTDLFERARTYGQQPQAEVPQQAPSVDAGKDVPASTPAVPLPQRQDDQQAQTPVSGNTSIGAPTPEVTPTAQTNAEASPNPPAPGTENAESVVADARRDYSRGRKTVEEIQEAYNLTDLETEYLGSLSQEEGKRLSDFGQVAHEMRGWLLDAKNRDAFNEMADVFTGGEARIADETADDPGARTDRVLDAIASMVGKRSVSELDRKDWDKIIKEKGSQLSDANLAAIEYSMMRQEQWHRNFMSLLNDKDWRKTVEALVKETGATTYAELSKKIRELRGKHPGQKVMEALLNLGRKYASTLKPDVRGLSDAAIKRAFDATVRGKSPKEFGIRSVAKPRPFPSGASETKKPKGRAKQAKAEVAATPARGPDGKPSAIGRDIQFKIWLGEKEGTLDSQGRITGESVLDGKRTYQVEGLGGKGQRRKLYYVGEDKITKWLEDGYLDKGYELRPNDGPLEEGNAPPTATPVGVATATPVTTATKAAKTAKTKTAEPKPKTIAFTAQNWREVYAKTEDDWQKNDILKRIAQNSKSDKVLSEVLDKTSELFDRTRMGGGVTSNTAWDVAHNPKASEATKQRAMELYERIMGPDADAPAEDLSPVEEYEINKQAAKNEAADKEKRREEREARAAEPKPEKAPKEEKEPKLKPGETLTERQQKNVKKKEEQKRKADAPEIHRIPVAGMGGSVANASVFIEADINPKVGLKPPKDSRAWRVIDDSTGERDIVAQGATYDEAMMIALDYAEMNASAEDPGDVALSEVMADDLSLPDSVPAPPYTLTVLKQLDGLQKNAVQKDTIKQWLKQKNVSQIERDIIEDILARPELAETKYIPKNELIAMVRHSVIPWRVIESKSYSDYGMKKLGLLIPDHRTYIFNGPIEHGRTGHFDGDFNGRNTKWRVETRVEPETGVAHHFAVKEGVELTEANVQESVGTASVDRELVEAWIKQRNEASTIDRGLAGHQRVWRDGKTTLAAEGQSDYYQKQDPYLFLAKDFKRRYNEAGIPPGPPDMDVVSRNMGRYDAGRKYIDANTMVEGFENRAEELKKAEEFLAAEQYQEAAYSLMVRMLEWGEENPDKIPPPAPYNPDIPYGTDEWLAADAEREAARKRRSQALNEAIRQDPEMALLIQQIENGKLPDGGQYNVEHFATFGDLLAGRPGNLDHYKEYLATLQGNIQRMQENVSDLGQKEVERKLWTRKREEARKEMEQYFSLEEKQFVAHRKNYMDRILRETIRREAVDGQEVLAIPTPRTLAMIEGYISSPNSGRGLRAAGLDINPDVPDMNFSIIESSDPEGTHLLQGDRIEHAGEEYYVTSSYADSFYGTNIENTATFPLRDWWARHKSEQGTEATQQLSVLLDDNRHYGQPDRTTYINSKMVKRAGEIVSEATGFLLSSADVKKLLDPVIEPAQIDEYLERVFLSKGKTVDLDDLGDDRPGKFEAYIGTYEYEFGDQRMDDLDEAIMQAYGETEEEAIEKLREMWFPLARRQYADQIVYTITPENLSALQGMVMDEARKVPQPTFGTDRFRAGGMSSVKMHAPGSAVVLRYKPILVLNGDTVLAYDMEADTEVFVQPSEIERRRNDMITRVADRIDNAIQRPEIQSWVMDTINPSPGVWLTEMPDGTAITGTDLTDLILNVSRFLVENGQSVASWLDHIRPKVVGGQETKPFEDVLSDEELNPGVHSSAHATVIKKYQQQVKAFKKERPDAYGMKDSSGNWWLATKLTEADKGDVVAFNEDPKAQKRKAGRRILAAHQRPLMNLVRDARMERTQRGMIRGDEAANAALKRFFDEGWGEGRVGVFYGFYLRPSQLNFMLATINQKARALQRRGDVIEAQQLATFARKLQEARDPEEHDLIFYTDLADAPAVVQGTLQEEMLHRADFRIRQFTDLDRSHFAEVEGYRKAHAYLKENLLNKGDEHVHNEVVAKAMRSDGAAHLGVSEEEKNQIILAYVRQLTAAGARAEHIEQYFGGTEEISALAEQLVNYAKEEAKAKRRAGRSAKTPDEDAPAGEDAGEALAQGVPEVRGGRFGSPEWLSQGAPGAFNGRAAGDVLAKGYEPDRPVGARIPEVNWLAPDLPRRNEVTPETLMSDAYFEHKVDPSTLRREYVPLDKLSPRAAGESYDYDWSELEDSEGSPDLPAIKVLRKQDGSMVIPDGNHRAQFWKDKGYTHAPAWVADELGDISLDEIPQEMEKAYQRVAKLLYDGKRDVSFPEAFVNLVRTGYLAGYSVIQTNVAGNTLNAIFEQLVKPFAAAADMTNAAINPNAKGLRATPGFNPLDVATGLFGEHGAFREGLGFSDKGLMGALVHGVPTYEQKNFDLTSGEEGNPRFVRNFGIPALDAAIEGVKRLAVGIDRPFKAFGRASETRGLERIAHRNVGNLPDAPDSKLEKEWKRAMELIEQDPTLLIQPLAEQYAESITFQNPNAVTDIIDEFRAKLLNPKLIGQFVPNVAQHGVANLMSSAAYIGIGVGFPFVRTPTNIGLRTLEYTPLIGAITAGAKLAQIGNGYQRRIYRAEMVTARRKYKAEVRKARTAEDKAYSKETQEKLQKYRDQYEAKKLALDEMIDSINASKVLTDKAKRERIKENRKRFNEWNDKRRAARDRYEEGRKADREKIFEERKVEDAKMLELYRIDDAISDIRFTAIENKMFAEAAGRQGLALTIAGVLALMIVTGIMDGLEDAQMVGTTDYDMDRPRYMAQRQAGIPNASINIAGRRVPFDTFPGGGALNITLGQIEQLNRPGSIAEKRDAMVTRGLRDIANLSPLTSQEFKRDDWASWLGAKAVASTPFLNMKIMQEAGEILDPKARKYFGEGFWAQYQYQTPVWRESLPEAKTTLGKRPETPEWRLVRKLDPFRTVPEVKPQSSLPKTKIGSKK